MAGQITTNQSLKQFDSLPDCAYVNARTVSAILGVSNATVWRMVKRGTLPAPRNVAERSTRWNVGELRKAIAA